MDETDTQHPVSGGALPACVFATQILQRRAGCCRCQKTNIAERESVDCRDVDAHSRCREYLATVRRQADFVLKRPATRLSFNQVLQLQSGAVEGLADLLSEALPVENIDGLLAAALARWGRPDAVPPGPIVRAIAAARPPRRLRRNKPRW